MGVPLAAKLIRTELDRRGWSQNELARQLDVLPGTLSRWMAGERPMTDLAAAVRLEELLGVPPAAWVQSADESGSYTPAAPSRTG